MIYIKENNTFNKYLNFSDISLDINLIDKVTKNTFLSNISFKIIGYYILKDKIHCSIRECNTAHYRGYIVNVENNGFYLIGNKCGEKIFGESFDEKSRLFRHSVNAYEKIEKIKSLKNLLADYENEYAKYKKDNLNVYTKAIKKLELSKVIGDDINSFIKNKVTSVIINRKATKKEREQLIEITGKDKKFIDDNLGDVKFTQCLYHENNILMKNTELGLIIDKLNSINLDNINSISQKTIEEILSQANYIQSIINSIKENIELLDKFFTIKNLAPLAKKHNFLNRGKEDDFYLLVKEAVRLSSARQQKPITDRMMESLIKSQTWRQQ